MPEAHQRATTKGLVFWADDDFGPEESGEQLTPYKVRILRKSGYHVEYEYKAEPRRLGTWIRRAARVQVNVPKFLVLDQIWPNPLGAEGGWKLYTAHKAAILDGFDGVIFYTKNPTRKLGEQIAREGQDVSLMFSLVDGPKKLAEKLDARVKELRQGNEPGG